MLSFDLGSRARVKALFENVQYALVGVSLGGVESILSYPAQMSHAAMPKVEREKRGITDGLVRLSLGVEDVTDVLADLERGLKAGESIEEQVNV